MNRILHDYPTTMLWIGLVLWIAILLEVRR